MALIPCAYILLSAYLLLKYDILFFPKSPPGFSLLRAWQERKACALRSCFGSSFAPPVFPATGFGISRRILPSFITQYINHILNYIGQFGEKIAPEFGNIYIGSIRRAISNALCFSPSMIPSSTICRIASHILVFSPSMHLSISFTVWLFCSILRLPALSA